MSVEIGGKYTNSEAMSEAERIQNKVPNNGEAEAEDYREADTIVDLENETAAKLHKKWQEDFRINNNGHNDRFKPAGDDPNWEERIENVEFTEEGEIVINRGTAKEATLSVLKSPDGKIAKYLDPDGKNVMYLDILNTDYPDLSEQWKNDNRMAAESALTIVKKHEGDFGPDDIEKISAAVHQAFLDRRKAEGAYIPEEQDLPYGDLPDKKEDGITPVSGGKEADRVIVNTALEVIEEAAKRADAKVEEDVAG